MGNSAAVRVLIDGGNSSDGDKVLAKLGALGVRHLDHVVCTHPHDDHAAGLVAILKNKAITIGHFWMPLPWSHINYAGLTASLSRAAQSKVANIVRASLDRSQELYGLAIANKTQVSEPFDRMNIGPLYVCGPTVQFYRDLLLEFSDLEKLQQYDTALAKYEQKLLVEKFSEGVRVGGRPLNESDGELGAGRTEPENDSSVILTAYHGTSRFLFTADAGVPALQAAVSRYYLNNLHWMQIPHHGSRRNITEELIGYFNAKYAFVSAEGSIEHPRRKVVNAFKSAGTKVYSTHYPKSLDLWRRGNVRERAAYGPATELYADSPMS